MTDAFGLSASNLTPAGSSSYCFHDLPFTPHNIQATLIPFGAGVVSDTTAFADLGPGGAFSGCPNNTQAYVVTVTPGVQSVQEGFFVAFN